MPFDHLGTCCRPTFLRLKFSFEAFFSKINIKKKLSDHEFKEIALFAYYFQEPCRHAVVADDDEVNRPLFLNVRKR